jgi:hypothetical protein
MISSRIFVTCLLWAVVGGGLLAILDSPIAGLVLGAVLAIGAAALLPCSCFVDWDAKLAMRAHDSRHARHPPVTIVTRQRTSPVPHPGRRNHLMVVHPPSGHAARGTMAPAPIRFMPRR